MPLNQPRRWPTPLPESTFDISDLTPRNFPRFCRTECDTWTEVYYHLFGGLCQDSTSESPRELLKNPNLGSTPDIRVECLTPLILTPCEGLFLLTGEFVAASSSQSTAIVTPRPQLQSCHGNVV